jgi:hypothetical protein
MRKKSFLVAMVAAATMFGSAAHAQSFGVGVGPAGVGVSVDDGPRARFRDRDDYYDRRDWRRSRNETVIIKERRPRRVVREYYTD